VYRFLLSRQWVVFTLIGLVLMPVMVKLGIWQMHRHEQEDANNALIRQSLAAPTVPVEKLTAPGARVASHDNFRSVTATGRYDTAHQVVVRHRTSADDSAIGYYLITPLVMADSRAVLVNRGWIPAPQSGDDAQFPALPSTPSGQVSITGRIRPDESTASTGILDRPGLPPHMIMLINSGKLAKQLPEPVLGGYVELTGTSPRPAGSRPQPVPAPPPARATAVTPPRTSHTPGSGGCSLPWSRSDGSSWYDVSSRTGAPSRQRSSPARDRDRSPAVARAAHPARCGTTAG
jgi:cytochrome oxidase assembly protein ShyY1